MDETYKSKSKKPIDETDTSCISCKSTFHISCKNEKYYINLAQNTITYRKPAHENSIINQSGTDHFKTLVAVE